MRHLRCVGHARGEIGCVPSTVTLGCDLAPRANMANDSAGSLQLPDLQATSSELFHAPLHQIHWCIFIHVYVYMYICVRVLVQIYIYNILTHLKTFIVKETYIFVYEEIFVICSSCYTYTDMTNHHTRTSHIITTHNEQWAALRLAPPCSSVFV